MDTKELLGLYEAYNQVYETESEYIPEEVDIATEYFINEGYDESDIKNLIEEIGVEQFSDLVYEIADSYELTEARRGGVRIEPVTKTGKSVGQLKGGPKTAAITRLRKEKAARKESEAKASSEKPSGLKSFMKSTASKPESKSQSQSTENKRQGIGGLIGGALRVAGERAKKDIALTRQSLDTAKSAWQSASDTKAAQRARIGLKKGARAVEKHGHTVGAAAGKALGTAAAATLRAGKKAGQSKTGQEIKQRVAKVVLKNDVDVYNTVLSHLLDEGFADNIESAEKIMVNMSEEWVDSILDESGSGNYREPTGRSDRNQGRNRYMGGGTPEDESAQKKREDEAVARLRQGKYGKTRRYR